MDATANEKRGNTARWILLTLFFWLSAYPFVPIVSAYASDMGANDAMIGIIGGAYGLTMTFLRFPVGVISDRLGKRKIFIVGGVICAMIASAVVLLRPSPVSLFVCRAFCGLHASSWVPFTVLYASSWKPSESARAMAVLTAVYTCGQLSSMLFGGILADAYTYSAPFILALGGGAAFLLCSPLMRDTTKNVKEAKPLPVRDSDAGTPKKGGRLSFLTPRLLILTFIAAVFYYIKYATAYTFTPLIAKDMGASPAMLGYLSTIYCACGVLGSAVSYKLAKRIGSAKIIAVSMLFLAVFSCFIVPYVKNLPFLYVTIGISGLFTFLLDALLAGVVILGVEERHRTTAMGFYQALYGGGILLGPVVSGFIIDFSSTVTAYMVAGILAVISAAAVLIFDRKEKIPC